jgi:nitroimidazol reductase NimA-like FMN-containing flavoprotein (pyridoxamine 5'-phosphate oxidase superfamily)
MRKKEREIKGLREIEEVLMAARVLRLGINEAGSPPYVVPVNFGYRDGAIYFHSSVDGKKMELIATDPVVSFEAEADVSIVGPSDRARGCDWGTAFRSVIGRGRARLIDDPEEKRAALRAIMSHYAPEVDRAAFIFRDEVLKITAVVRIEIEAMTGKKNRS